MNKKQALKDLFKTLTKALDDAHHCYFVDEPAKALEFMDLADKTMDAIRLLKENNDAEK